MREAGSRYIVVRGREEVAGLEDIAGLVFGGVLGELFEALEAHDACDPHEHLRAGRNTPAGDWCQTSTGEAEPTGLGAALFGADKRRRPLGFF